MRKTLLILTVLGTPLAAQNAPPLFETTRAEPVLAGPWSYVPTANGSEAVLRNRFSIACNRMTRRVTLRRIEPIASAPASGAMTITTDLGAQTLPAEGVVAANDRVLDAIAFSRGRFIVTGGGAGSRLIVSTSPEAARSIEDCRI